MPDTVLDKLPALFATVLLGWAAARWGWLTDGRKGGAGGADPARVLSAAAQYLFIPALLFRAMARLDFAHMPWRTLAAYYGPLLAMVLAVYLVQRWRLHGAAGMALSSTQAAVPATRAVTAGFGNSVQVGVPVAAALYGEAGLAIHVPIVSLHALTLLTLLTVLAEADLARARLRHADGRGGSMAAAVRATVRATLIHPVVLPVLAGLGWNLLGLPLPAALDEWLRLLASAVAPLCLLLIGLSLGRQSLHGTLRGVFSIALLKLFLLPVLVLAAGKWVFGLEPLALSVAVMAAALPPGSNALIFAQRYRTLETETAAATLLCTLAFALTAPLWVLVLARIPG
ncbi:AEC family transporter [Azohydromonas caseinilytica]|uniref:AEC family transporter n=1 Tax=Azohydromonas caseinilytica TaxID=2728836 RepID=A0A848FDI9_9BURK|nr:AEC family transporter [Azohydromonas caseinilytica]NML16220.1 AEC family transporter [Azohydromonas caseinilytica]